MRFFELVGALVVAVAIGIGVYRMTVAFLRGAGRPEPCERETTKPNKEDANV